MELFIDPETAVSDLRNAAPLLCLAVSLVGSAGPFFNLKCGEHAAAAP